MPNNDEARTPVTPDEIRTIADILSSYSVSSTGLDHYVAQLRRLADQLPAILNVLRAGQAVAPMLECYCAMLAVDYKELPCDTCRFRNALAALGEGPR